MNLTPGELEVMQVLWTHGSLKPGDIQERFPRPIRNETLRSALRVLLEKGAVTRRREGKAYFYAANVPRLSAFKRMMRKMTETFWGGSLSMTMLYLIENERLNKDELEELQRLSAEKLARMREANAGSMKREKKD